MLLYVLTDLTNEVSQQRLQCCLERCATEFDNEFKPGLNQVRLDICLGNSSYGPLEFSKDVVIGRRIPLS